LSNSLVVMKYTDAPARVSVVIAAYNAEAFLADCLSSVLAQSHCPAEVIVVDDGSKDGTGNVARSFGDRVTYLCQQNAGPAAARNRGILAARNEWIAFIDSDDMWKPWRLERELKLARKTGADVVCADAEFLSYETGASWLTSIGLKQKLEVIAEDGILPDPASLLLKFGCFVTTSTLLVRRPCLLDAGLFDETFRVGEDFELFFRLALQYRFAIELSPLAVRRIHDENISRDRHRWVTDAIRIREKIESYLLGPEQEWMRAMLRQDKAHCYRELGSLSLQRGEVRHARESWATSLGLRISPVVCAYWLSTFLPASWVRALRKLRYQERLT
jgi:glycosyltransferase involved in cell wall biosynthesis